MRRLRVLVPLFVVLAGLLYARSASAQGNYRAVPTGGRSALMGNTGVAEARDGAAPFLNPATLVDVVDEQVALSVNAYAATFTTITGLHAPRGGGGETDSRTVDDAHVDALPSTFCIFLTLGEKIRLKRIDPRRSKLALCAGTSERRALSVSSAAQGLTPDGRNTLHLASLERSYGRIHVGPTFATSLSPRLALGASLHVVDTRATSVTTADGTTLGKTTDSSAYTESTSAVSFDAALLLGATYRIERATTLGLAFAPPSVHVTSGLDASDHSQQGDLARTRAASGSFSAPLPMRVAAGLATQAGALRLHLDATYFFPMNDAFRSELDIHTIGAENGTNVDRVEHATATTAASGVLDSALGAEWFVSESISVLGGVATDFGATPAITSSPALGIVTMSRENRVLMSLGVGSYGSGSELLIGVQVAAARGETVVGDSYAHPSDLAPVHQHSMTVLFLIAGSTSLSTIRRTFDDIRHTLPIR